MLTLSDIIKCGAELEIVETRIHLNEPIPIGVEGFRQMVTLTYNIKEHNIIRDWMIRKNIENPNFEYKGWAIDTFGQKVVLETVTFEIRRIL